MVSASHNPFHDNGVKVFGREGAKLSDEVEAAIERDMDAEPAPADDEDALLAPQAGLHAHYLAFLERCLGGTRLDGLKVVLDAAHGAAYEIGPEAFRAAGADVVVIGDKPDGRNINEACGSLYPEQLAERVRAEGADLGFFAGRALHHASRLPNATVVSTVMSNLGLEKALEREGIKMLRTKVGDRYVLEAMRAGGHALGGEQSGHVIFMEHAPTGDGVLTALTMAKLVRDGAGNLDEALDSIPRYPQLLKNVKVSSKPAIEEHPILLPAQPLAVVLELTVEEELRRTSPHRPAYKILRSAWWPNSLPFIGEMTERRATGLPLGGTSLVMPSRRVDLRLLAADTLVPWRRGRMRLPHSVGRVLKCRHPALSEGPPLQDGQAGRRGRGVRRARGRRAGLGLHARRGLPKRSPPQ